MLKKLANKVQANLVNAISTVNRGVQVKKSCSVKKKQMLLLY